MNQTTIPEKKLPTILIVDDTPANIGVIAENLEDLGYRILVAQDGAEGLQRAEFAKPDLILLDVMMPEIDGFEVCKLLKKQASTRDIPVIFMTARAETDDKVAGFDAGAVDYVTKPLQIEEVVARVSVQLNLSDMQKRLETQNAQLQRYREQLEQRVAERTMELNTANQRLRAEIQERKLAQQELAAREREFRTLAENIPDHIIRYDQNGRKTYLNTATLRLMGAKAEELLDQSPEETPQEKRAMQVDEFAKRLRLVLETGEPQELEVPLRHAEKGMQVHDVRFVAERNEQGRIVGALMVGRDITEQKFIAAAIRERELRYRQLFENSPISIWEEDFSAVHTYFNELREAGVDDLGEYFDAHPEAVGHCAELARIVDVNQAAVTLHRAQSKAELFAGLKQTFTPDSFSAFREELIGLWRGETDMKLDAVVQTLAGEPRHVAVQFSIAPDTGTPWSRMLVSLVDITERKQAEQQLAMLGAAIDHAHEAAYFVDEHGGFFYVNEEASRMLGYSREELLGMTVMDIAPGWTLKMMAESWQALSKVGALTIEAEHQHKDGRIIPVEINITHMNYGGRAFNLAMVRDITERKRAERELHLRNMALDSSFDATYLVNTDLRLRYVNEAAVRALGYSREELLSMSLPDIDPSVTREAVRELMRQTADKGHFPGTVESRHRRKNGETFPIEVGATTFSYEGEALFLTVVRDISERKEAENILRASEEKYRTLVRKVQAGVIVHGADTQILTSNPVAQQILGLSEEQLQGKKAIDPGWHFFREDGSAASLDEYPVNKVLATREPLKNYVLGIHRPAHGEDVWGLVNAIPVFGKEGEITQVIVTFIDITERKRAEELLREERGLFVGGPTVVFKWQARDGWPVEYVSPNVLDQFGYSQEELTGGTISFSSIVHPDDLARVREEVSSYTAEGRSSYEQVYRIAHAKGGYRWIYDFTLVRRKTDGTVQQYLGYLLDITDQKIAENELKEREQRYREIFDNAVEGMYLLEVTEDGRFRSLDINPALVASTGIPREFMIGKYVEETVSEDTGRLLVEKYRRCVEAGTTITESVELDLPAGKRFYYSTITPIYYDGRIHRLIGISRDITDLKKAERELQESREQLRGLTARREAAREEERKYIAREVHDELGQVLTGLQLNISVLEHKFAPDLPNLRAHLKETKVLTDRALSVARNVASALRPAALDLGINSALEWLTGRFSTNTGIQCEVHISENEINIDESHATALFRIVQESLTNISRHAKATRADVTFGKDGDDYLLSVRDNGKGFETDTKKLDSYGLVGIKERALMLGGTVIIESKPGKGTQISVRIPINKQGVEA